MAKVTVYHNPRCSKSRQTLALLEDHGVESVVVEYLKDAPDAKALKALVKKLGLRPKDAVRKGEAVFKELGLSNKLDDDDAMIRAIAKHPILLERPIVVAGAKARLGRPPEQVLEII